MTARESILNRLRSASVSQKPPLPDVSSWYAKHGRNEDLSLKVSRLRKALEEVKTEVYETTDKEWPEVLLKILASKGLKNLLIGTDTEHGAVLEKCNPNIELIYYKEPIHEWQNQLFDSIDASLTRARGAIAEVGSLILWPSSSEPRLMSLVPSVHFALLDTNNIHADFFSAMTSEKWVDALPTNALLVGGPSKTADIQQTLAYGAHGPRELVVLLCHPQKE